jgi:prophage regulatory protein
MNTATISKLLSRRETMAAVGVSSPTLWRLVRRGEFPSPRRAGLRRLVWDAGEVQEWLDSRRIVPEPEAEVI